MKIVIIYTYYKSVSSDYNLDFFVKNEVKYRDNISYIIVINNHECDILFPDLPNLTIIRRPNIGFDFGGHNAALNHLDLNNIKTYSYYFFMNSGVIGPILNKDLTDLKDFHWSSIFINKINNKVKLVGTTIVCLPKEDLGGIGPKVEGFFFMTDQVGLNLLRRKKTIFCDHKDKESAIIDGEYGLSKCIMSRGYTIDCMLKKYEGVDWTNKQNWNKNNYLHPSRENSYYNNSIDPFEVIFHKWYWHGLPTVNYDIIMQYVNSKQ